MVKSSVGTAAAVPTIDRRQSSNTPRAPGNLKVIIRVLSQSWTRAGAAVARALRGPSAMAGVMRGTPPSTEAPRGRFTATVGRLKGGDGTLRRLKRQIVTVPEASRNPVDLPDFKSGGPF